MSEHLADARQCLKDSMDLRLKAAEPNSEKPFANMGAADIFLEEAQTHALISIAESLHKMVQEAP